MRTTHLQLVTAFAVLAPTTLFAAPPRSSTLTNTTVTYTMGQQRSGSVAAVRRGRLRGLRRAGRQGTAAVLTELQIANPDPQNGNLGIDVVVQGDTAFVGSPAFTGQSQVYVFERLSSSWVQQQAITPPDSPIFFGIQIAVSGDRMAVLGLNSSFPPFDRGGVYTYQLQPSGEWQFEQKLVTSSTTSVFTTVSLEGETLVAGDQTEGAAVVFEFTSGRWQRTQQLVATDATVNFPISVEQSNGTLVVTDVEIFGSSPGAAFVFEKTSGGFRETQKLVSTSTGSFGALGVDIDGPDLAIGDFANETVSMYRRRGGQWSPTQVITLPPGAEAGSFGFAVDLDDGRLVVGSRGQADGGSAYLYRRVRGQWELELEIESSDLGPDDAFANTVSIDGTSLFVGAQNKDSFVGAAYAFQLLVPGEPSLVGASLGNDDFPGLGRCAAQTSIDGLPVVFDRKVAPFTVSTRDFVVVTASGARVRPDCVSFFPSVNFDEGQTILTQGQFGGAGDTPIAVEIVGSIRSFDRTVDYRGQSISVTPFDTGAVLTYARELPVQRLGQFDQCPVGTGQIIQLAFGSNVGANLAGTFPLTADFLGSFTVELADGTVVSPFNFGDTTADNYVELCLVATSPAIAVNVAPQTVTNAGGILNGAPLRAIVQRF